MENNLFEQFAGSDLDRLIECIKKIKAEGLTIDKYCQSGINQSSGNVYIYSEDWVGCVYCSIGFDVQWSYSCPDCGEEYDFDTEAECRAYADAHDYKCEACNPEESED